VKLVKEQLGSATADDAILLGPEPAEVTGVLVPGTLVQQNASVGTPFAS
jgi:hypothetical protein